MQDHVSGRVINASDLLGGVKLEFRAGAPPPRVPEDVEEDEGGGEGSHLTEVAAALRDSFYAGSWAVTDPAGAARAGKGATTGGGGVQAPAAGVAPEIYTVALRAALVEFGEAPSSTLGERLRAADALAPLLGMSKDAHEALLVRAVTTNEGIVHEMQSLAYALHRHSCGLAPGDFVTREAYDAWRQRALRAVRALLLSQQATGEYNALLEVSLLEARDLATPGSKGGSGFMCCFKPDDVPLCPYAWAHLAVPSGGPAPTAAALGARTQRTQVLADSGPSPAWQSVLQPMTLTNEQSELRFKVVQCTDPRLQPSVSRDQVMGVTGIKVAGLQPAVTQQVTLPLYVPPPSHGQHQGAKSSPSSTGAPASAADTEPNVFPRQVVYDPQRDELEGARGLQPQGRLVLRVRYLLERRTRCHVPSEAELFADEAGSDDEGADAAARGGSGQPRAQPGARNVRGGGGALASQPSADQVPSRGASQMVASPAPSTVSAAAQAAASQAAETLQVAVRGVVEGAKVTADYLQQLGVTLAQGLTDNPLASAAAKNLFTSRFKLVNISLLAEPVPLPRTPSLSSIRPYDLIKQLAVALAQAARARGSTGQSSVNVTLGVLPLLPTIPANLMPLLLSPSRRHVLREHSATTTAPEAPQPAPGQLQHHHGKHHKHHKHHKQHAAAPPPAPQPANRNKKGLPPVAPPTALAPLPPPAAEVDEVEVRNGLQDLWGLLMDAMVRPYLPLGPGLGVLLRAAILLQVRAETVLILLMRFMLDDWPTYINTTVKRRAGGTAGGGGSAGGTAAAGGGGGAQDYLSALRAVWEKCLSWHAAGTLTKDETEGVKGVMGLLLGCVLPALERHYSVFVGNEGAVCFTTCLELVGWAWTWDPHAPVPYTLLGDYLKDAATSPLRRDFRPQVATLTQDIEALAEEVLCASECLTRDRDIQAALPGLKGFAATNAAVRYELLVDHVEATLLYQPGNSLEAMQAMFHLEAALLEHHRLLVAEGYALPLSPPPAPRHLLPQAKASTTQELHSQLSQPLPSRAPPGDLAGPLGTGEFNETGFERLSVDRERESGHGGGGGGGGLSGAQLSVGGPSSVGSEGGPPSLSRLSARRSRSGLGGSGNVRGGGGPAVVLWDWESAAIEELCRWVKTGVADLWGQMTRLVAAETWQPVSKHDGTARSALELSRLIEVRLSSWLEAACSGSDARRLHVGVLIAACVMHLLYEYMAAAAHAWEKELEVRSSLFTGAPAGAKPANGATPGHRRNPSNQAVDASLASGAGAPTPGAGGPSPFAANPFSATPTPGGGGGGGNGVYAGGSVLVPGSTTHAPFIPGMSAASAPALVRVVSLAVGMGANASVMQLPPDAAFFALPPGGAAGGPPVHAGASTLYAGSSIMGQAPGAAALAAGPGGGAGAGAGAGAGGGGPRHHRSTSRSTAFASTQGAAQLRDVAVMRDAAEAALAAQPGVCLSGTMCVIRSTLHKVNHEARDIGAVLLLHLVAPHLPKAVNSSPAAAKIKAHAVSHTDSEGDDEPGLPPAAVAGRATRSAISAGYPSGSRAPQGHVGSTSLKQLASGAGGGGGGADGAGWGKRTSGGAARGGAAAAGNGKKASGKGAAGRRKGGGSTDDDEDEVPSRSVPAEPPSPYDDEAAGGWGRKRATPPAAAAARNAASSSSAAGHGRPPADFGKKVAGAGSVNKRDGAGGGAAAGAASGFASAAAQQQRQEEEDPSKPIFNFVAAWWHELARRHASVVTSMVSSYSVSLRSSLVSLMVASCGIKPGDPVKEDILKGLMTALDDELGVMGQGLGGDAVLLAECSGALWRATTSSLQLLALNQAGFRPLVEQECELFRDLLTSFQSLYKEVVPKWNPASATSTSSSGASAQAGAKPTAAHQALALDLERLPDPGYPALLEAQRRAALPPPSMPRQLTAVHSGGGAGAAGGRAAPPLPETLHPGLLASLDVPLLPHAPEAAAPAGGKGGLAGGLPPPPAEEDPGSRRVASADYCAALLQLACEDTPSLQDLFRAQEASLQALQHATGKVYVQLSPQQLPMLDLLRLLRARRKTEPAAAAWADQQLKDNGANLDKVLFGLVHSERVVAEFKCVLAGASRSAGRLYITQNTLCFTTMLDADAKALTDTTLSVLRRKVVSVGPGAELGSLVLTTSNHDILAFTSFASPAERDRFALLLTTPPQQQQQQQQQGSAGGAAAAAAANSRTQPQPRTSGGAPATAAAAGPGPSPTTAQQQQQQRAAANGKAASAAAVTTAAAATAAAARGSTAANGSVARAAGSVSVPPAAAAAAASGGSSTTRRPPSRDPWAARQAAADDAAALPAAAASRDAGAEDASGRTSRPSAQTIPAPAGISQELPSPLPAPSPTAPSATAAGTPSGGGGGVGPSAAPPSAPSPPPPQAPLMTAPCSLYGLVKDRPGVLALYPDRLEFVGLDNVVLHRVGVGDVAAVTQQPALMGGNRLVIKVDNDATVGAGAQLQFTGLSDMMIASLKQSIIDLA